MGTGGVSGGAASKQRLEVAIARCTETDVAMESHRVRSAPLAVTLLCFPATGRLVSQIFGVGCH